MLRQAREACAMTQRDVAQRLSIPQSTVSEIETGQRRLDMAELMSLAEVYDRPASYFLTASDDGNGHLDGPARPEPDEPE